MPVGSVGSLAASLRRVFTSLADVGSLALSFAGTLANKSKARLASTSRHAAAVVCG